MTGPMDELFDRSARWQALDEALGRSLGPRPPSMLFDVAAGLALPGDGPVLDAGCRDGAHARTLAERLGRLVLGVDLVRGNLSGVRTAAVADVAALPFPAGAFALVWCRDTLELVPDPAATVAEMARVLRPGGAVLLYTAWATEALEPAERARLFSALALSPAGADRACVEAAIGASGLAVESFEEVSPEWAEHDLEHGGGRTVASLLTLARLRRGRDRFAALAGERAYEQAVAFSQWAAYLVLGKLQTGLWVLRRS
ncbi:MAG TPA: class I SAM-dependent methyltransferase [Acidimicrobiales bacterium]|jgi:SAM-dependent methyltransferase